MGGRALWQICNVRARRKKDTDSLYNRGNKSVHSVPAGSFIMSQERDRGRSGKAREREREEAVGTSKIKKKVIGLDGAG